MSELRANTISDAAGTGPVTLTGQSAAKAWALLNGSSTLVVRDSFNQSSVVDNGVGLYAVNVTNNFSSLDYAVTAGSFFSANGTTGGSDVSGAVVLATSQYYGNNVVIVGSNSFRDVGTFSFSCMGDLA